MAKETKNNQNPPIAQTQGEQNKAESQPPLEETLEQKVVRLEADNAEKQKALLAAQSERDMANDIAQESSIKLKKLEGVKSDSTVEIGDDTYKINLKKGALRTTDSAIAVKFQFIKNEDGSVDADHIYPEESHWKELAKIEGVLTKL